MFKNRVDKKIVICLMIAVFIFGSMQPAIKAAAAENTQESGMASSGIVLANINLRSDASTTSKIIGKLKTGENVELLDHENGSDGHDWYFVKTAAGTKGYVYAAAIDKEITKKAQNTDKDTNFAANSGESKSIASEGTSEIASSDIATEADSETDNASVSASDNDENAVESISKTVLATDPSDAGEPTTVAPDVAAADYSKVFKFKNDMLFSGIYKTTSFFFQVEKYWDTKYIYATIEYTVSPLIKNDVPASMTFFVNNTPVYSCKIEYNDGKSQVTYVRIPVELLDEGYNNFAITGYVRLYDDNGCLDDFSGANWINISKDSQIQAGYNLKDTENHLNYYPYPMMSTVDEFGKKCEIYVPEEASDEELRAALLIRADLGNETTDEDDIGLQTMENLNSGDGNKVIIAAKNHLPKDVLNQMPQNSYDLSKGALIYEYKDVSGNVLVLTADKDQDLYEACTLLMDEDRISQEKRNIAYAPAGSAAEVIKNRSLSDLIADSETIEGITGDAGLEFVGPFRQEQILYLPVTGGFVLAEGGKISLNFRYSKNLDFSRSMITVYWGNTPVASKKLEKENADGDSLSFVMPSDVVGTYASSIKIAFDLEIEDMYCTKRADEMPWAYVTGDSTLFLPVGQSSKYSLDLRPYPFQLMGNFNDLAIILPDKMTPLQLDLAGRIIALEGNSIGPYGKISVYRASEFDPATSDTNQIVIGTYQNNSYIKKLNTKLSFKYSNDGNKFASNEKLLLSDNYASNIGILQIIRSPQYSGRAIMVVSGTGEDTLKNILNYTRISENCWKFKGDSFLIDSTFDTKNYTFLKDEGKANVTLLQQILKNSDAIAFTLISTLAMAILVLAIILILLRIRKNSKSDEEK